MMLLVDFWCTYPAFYLYSPCTMGLPVSEGDILEIIGISDLAGNFP